MNHVIQQLKAGDRKTIEHLYKNYKPGFLLFLNKYALASDEILDIYQDAFVALVESAHKGKLDNLKVELKTYLYSIGKFMAFKKLKHQNTEVNIDWYEEYEPNAYSEEVIAALDALGPRCSQILKLFYYEEKSLDEIQLFLNYDKKDVLKSQKSRCLKQLKEIINERLNR